MGRQCGRKPGPAKGICRTFGVFSEISIFLLATHVLCGHVKDKLVTEQPSLPCCLFTCVHASLSARVMPMPGPFNTSWNEVGMTSPSTQFLLLPTLSIFKFKRTPCSFKAVYSPANLMVFMTVRRTQRCSVCLLPDVSSELSVSVYSQASQLQGRWGLTGFPFPVVAVSVCGLQNGSLLVPSLVLKPWPRAQLLHPFPQVSVLLFHTNCPEWVGSQDRMLL